MKNQGNNLSQCVGDQKGDAVCGNKTLGSLRFDDVNDNASNQTFDWLNEEK